jgi:hypothetical protein
MMWKTIRLGASESSDENDEEEDVEVNELTDEKSFSDVRVKVPCNVFEVSSTSLVKLTDFSPSRKSSSEDSYKLFMSVFSL